MKYWVFYKVRDENGNLLKHQTVYAFAFSKDDKKLFESIRDMNMFRCVKFDDVKNINRDFPTNFNRELYRLKLTRFSTVNDFGLKSYVDIQTTCEEEERTVLFYDKMYENLINKKLPSLSIFKKKIRDTLKILNYDYIVGFSNLRSYEDHWNDSITQTKTTVDEFSIFMKLYGNTIKSI